MIEHDPIHLDHGVVLGDDLLRGDIQHRFHHVNFMTDAVDDRDDEIQTGPHGFGIAAEAFDRVFHALRHRLDTQNDQDDRQHRQRHHKCGKALQHDDFLQYEWGKA